MLQRALDQISEFYIYLGTLTLCLTLTLDQISEFYIYLGTLTLCLTLTLDQISEFCICLGHAEREGELPPRSQLLCQRGGIFLHRLAFLCLLQLLEWGGRLLVMYLDRINGGRAKVEVRDNWD